MTEPNHHYRRPTDDLDSLVSHPSLADLARRGGDLYDLPTTSTGWVFAGTLLLSLLTAGAVGAGLLVIGAVLAGFLAASALRNGDLAAARTTLRMTRIGMLSWMLLCGALLFPVAVR